LSASGQAQSSVVDGEPNAETYQCSANDHVEAICPFVVEYGIPKLRPGRFAIQIKEASTKSEKPE
jgi:hypothetical protein